MRSTARVPDAALEEEEEEGAERAAACARGPTARPVRSRVAVPRVKDESSPSTTRQSTRPS
jgi:hypothetical protein